MRGWEIDDVEFNRRSYGNSYALPIPFEKQSDLAPIITKLVEKMSGRLRKAGLKTYGVNLGISFRDNTYWHKSMKTQKVIFESRDIYRHIMKLFTLYPHLKPVRKLEVSCFNLVMGNKIQLDLFGSIIHEEQISHAVDDINHKWGHFTVSAGRMLYTEDAVPDRIAFGGIKELEEFTTSAGFP